MSAGLEMNEEILSMPAKKHAYMQTNMGKYTETLYDTIIYRYYIVAQRTFMYRPMFVCVFVLRLCIGRSLNK